MPLNFGGTMGLPDFATERRKKKRYMIKDVAFAVLKSDTDEELGQIVNISERGLAFHYFVGNRKISEIKHLDIMLRRNGFVITGIPVRTVSDFQIKNELSFSTIVKRQQSVCFEMLDEEQQGKIDFLIKNHADSLEG
jgi:hypothetical protein